MLLKIALILAVILAVFLVIVAMRPSEFRVERSALVDAPPAAIFPHVNELRKWQAWSPWERVDPEMKRTYEGPDAGAGASYAWEGNRNIGSGRMTITESRPSEMVGIRLEFFKPMSGVSKAELHFRPQGERTLVTWTIAGENSFMAKAVGMFMSMDTMIGAQFEQGLANLGMVAGPTQVP